MSSAATTIVASNTVPPVESVSFESLLQRARWARFGTIGFDAYKSWVTETEARMARLQGR